MNTDDVTAEDDRKLLCQLLSKLTIPDETPELKVKALLVLTDSLKTVRMDELNRLMQN